MLAVTQSTPTHWVDRLASKPLGKFQFLLRRSKKPGKWLLLPFSSAQSFFFPDYKVILDGTAAVKSTDLLS